MNNNVINLKKIVAEQSINDELEISWIVLLAEKQFPVLSPAETREVVILTISQLVRDGVGVMKDFEKERTPQWIEWNNSPEFTFSEIKKRWYWGASLDTHQEKLVGFFVSRFRKSGKPSK